MKSKINLIKSLYIAMPIILVPNAFIALSTSNTQNKTQIQGKNNIIFSPYMDVYINAKKRSVPILLQHNIKNVTLRLHSK